MSRCSALFRSSAAACERADPRGGILAVTSSVLASIFASIQTSILASILALLATSHTGCGASSERRVPAGGGGGAGSGIPTAESLAETSAAPGAHIAIVYGSNLLAEYEPCGCPAQPLGGLARRATVVDRARADGAAVLVVDAGDALLPPVFHAPTPAPSASPPSSSPVRPAPLVASIAPRGSELERRANLILAAYALMGMSTAGALLPAERELGLGLPRLKRLLAAHQIPAVASNLSQPDGSPLFERDRLLTLAGIRIGIFGIVVPQPDDAAAWQGWPVRVEDPVATARTEIAALRQRGARVVVALIHVGSNEAARQLLAAAPGVDFAVQGHTQMQTETVDTVGTARRVEALGLGKLVGRLDVHVVEDSPAPAGPAQDVPPTFRPRPPRFTDRGDRAELRTILADHQRQLADIAKRASEDHTNQLESYYRSRREGLTAAMAHERDLLAHLPRSISGSWFENRLVPLDESIPDHPAVALLVAAYDAESARRAAAGLPVGVDWRHRDAAPPRPRSPRLPAAAKFPAAPP